MSDQAARARIDRWKQSLLDEGDRLLHLGNDGLAFPIDPVRIAFALAAGSMLGFETHVQPGLESGRLRTELSEPELGTRLRELCRAATDARRAEAEHVLWFALGLVTYADPAGTSRVAPLLLWPVELTGGLDGGPRLGAASDLRPRLNELLLATLRRDFGIAIDGADDLDPGALFAAVAEALDGCERCTLDRSVRLVTLSFARFDVWRDLEALGDDLLVSMPVGWLAGSRSAPALFSPPPGELLAPLDADASQLAAVAAAGAGGSFVLHGAPGTGKSQTIANLAVHCASHGKTVLVVSDRASALDVVHQRLAAVGLGELCLPLHAERKRVLAALARVFERTFKPVAGASLGDGRLAELRAALDGYATALHKVGPLGMSVHEVLGRLVELRTTPCAALAERDAAALDRGTFVRRKTAITALADAALAVEPVVTHPWRASALETLSADATERARHSLDEVADSVDTLESALADVGALVPGLVGRMPEQLRALGALADLAAVSPRPGAELLTSMRGARHDDIGERIALIRARGGGTLEVPRDPGSFLAIATRHRALGAEVDDFFTDAIDELDAGELWAQLKRWTGSMAALRYMALRNARAAVRAAAHPGQLETDAAMLGALEAVIAERACRDAMLAAAEPAKRWFGDLGGEPLALDLARIEDAVAWGVELRRAFDQVTIAGGEAGRQAAWRALVAQVAASPANGDKPAVELAPFARLATAVARWEPAVTELAAVTGIPLAQLGAGPEHLGALRDQVAHLRESIDTFADWVRFFLARRAAIVAGIGPAVAAIDRGDLAARVVADAWERAMLLAWLELEIAETPALAQFSGARHHAQVSQFADLDRGALALVRGRAIARVAERMPRAKDSSDPELALLRQELDANTARPLRAVLAELPTLLPRIAPIVLATPHALAAHLDPALPGFDLVVFDESSRLPVAHALGALARSKATVIVGDTRQAAPSMPNMAEGLLGLALAAKLPALTLGAHYRSRHEDLFAFANRRYYADRLELLPAPTASSELGIAWQRVDGTADGAGANRAEAEAIITALRVRLADTAQRPRTFAIVTMSRAQQDLVEQLLDEAAASDAALAALRASDGEHLLVGTPDRVQGEERDFVFVSIGDPATALGALAHDGGQRWLTVAITRAREQLTLVSSFAPEDIASDAPGARDLADLIAFARGGGGASRPADTAEPASPITAAIARALTERGWTVKHRVGCGRYMLDLAVVDPNAPDRYVLAIEHDGTAYASAPAARSRDRLRAQLLTQLGWRVHRVWSLDWWTDAERETQRAHGAIVAAIAASRQRRVTAPPRAVRARATSAPRVTPPSVSTPLLRDDTVPTGTTPALLAAGSGPTDALVVMPEGSGPVTPVRLPRGAIGIGPYTAAAVPAGRRAPDDLFAERYAQELGKCIEQVLAAEAPVHIDLLARRVGAYFGVGRVTPPVIEQIKLALAGRGKFGDEPGIVWRADQDPACVPPVRVAGQGASARRDIAEVPLSEVAAAARIVVERANGVATTDLVRDCARLLGFSRITEHVTARVSLGVRLAAARELIAIDAGKAHLMLD